jgi:hypothetical protein
VTDKAIITLGDTKLEAPVIVGSETVPRSSNTISSSSLLVIATSSTRA